MALKWLPLSQILLLLLLVKFRIKSTNKSFQWLTNMVLWDVEDPISSLWFANGLELWNNILMSKQNMLTKSIRHVMMEELLHKFLKVSVKVWHFFLRRYHCFLHWHGVTFLRRSCANYKTPRLLVLKEKMEKRWQTSHMHKTTGYAGERKVMQNTKNLKKKKKILWS